MRAGDDTRALDLVDPHESVMRLAMGHVAARIVHALAQFRIADHLAAGALNPAQLARLTNTHEPSLLRLLRAATVLRLLSEEEEWQFALTPLGEALRTDSPRHAASATLALGAPAMWNAFGELTRSIDTGQPQLASIQPFGDAVGFERTVETQIAFYGDEPAAIADAYDFSPIRVLADIGGSSGNLLTTLLARNPSMLGILYDLPYTAPAARRMVEQRGVDARCEVISGSFFDAVPTSADAYVLSHVVHDWPEEKCDVLLRNVRRVIPSDGRLLIIEPTVTSDSTSDVAKFLDIIAIAITGGRHRTVDEHRALLQRNGFRLTRVVETRAAASILESEPV
jgi:hypothetical protein